MTSQYIIWPTKEHAVLYINPRRPTIETGSPMVGCRVESRKIPDFGRAMAWSLPGQSIVGKHVKQGWAS